MVGMNSYIFGFICFFFLGRFCVLVNGAARNNSVSMGSLLHDTRDGSYRNPGWATTGPYRTGAVASGTSVTLTIRTATNDLTACYIRGWDNESFAEVITPMSVASSDGTYDYWQAPVTFNKATDYYYAFRLVDGSDEAWYQDDAARDGGQGAATNGHEYTRDYAIVWHRSDFTTPSWHKSAVIYQIMTDGFYNGTSVNDPRGNGTSGDVTWWEWDQNGTAGSNPGWGRSWIYKKAWGQSRGGGNDFYGGDFQGVQAKIPYLTDLGITAIYFNPWMESPDNHGYSVNNYKSVQPYYGVIDSRVSFDSNTDIVINDAAGSLAVFDAMISDLNSNGIAVISDMVLNHCGAQSRYFQRFEHISPNWQIYDAYPGSDGAYEDQTSPWSNWFNFNTWNHNYVSWWGYNNIPHIQYVNSTALTDLITGNNSVFDFWVSHGVQGYRLDVNNDYADGNHTRTVNREIRNKVKALNNDAVIIAEEWGKANPWLAGDMCDGNMNYRFRDAVIGWINQASSTDAFNNKLLAVQDDYPIEAQYSSWSLLGSHDTERIKTVLGSEAKQKFSAMIQFTHIGPPVIWAGDELGMTGGGDPDNRRSMDWGLATGDNDLLSLYKKLIHARRAYIQLTEGWITTLLTDNDIYAYGREYDNGSFVADAVVVLNRSASLNIPVTVDVSPLSGLAAGERLVDVLTGDVYTISQSLTVSLTVPSLGGVILVNPVGDFDSDGDVDIVDFAGLIPQWMDEDCVGPNWCNGRDLNKSGSVNVGDLAELAEHWLL